MKPLSIQVGTIGAMQRAHPALSQLWLRWTGIPDLDMAEFGTSRSEEHGVPDSSILLNARAIMSRPEGWAKLCDVLGFPEDSTERQTMPIRVLAKSPAHSTFWAAMKHREMAEVDGPLEWWWRLAVLRNRGLKTASKKLLVTVFGEDPLFDSAIASFENPSLNKEGRRAEEVIGKSYKPPTALLVTRSTSSKAKSQGLAFALTDDTLRARVTSSLIDLATSRQA
jgi:hypothetical protein